MVNHKKVIGHRIEAVPIAAGGQRDSVRPCPHLQVEDPVSQRLNRIQFRPRTCQPNPERTRPEFRKIRTVPRGVAERKLNCHLNGLVC